MEVRPSSSPSSRLRETWRSVLSWMRWRRRKKALRQAELQAESQRLEQRQLQQHQRLEQLLQQHRQLLEAATHLQLVEALIPVAAAMERLQTRNQELAMANQQFLVEILSSLQPSPEQQLLGSTRPPSS